MVDYGGGAQEKLTPLSRAKRFHPFSAKKPAHYYSSKNFDTFEGVTGKIRVPLGGGQINSVLSPENPQTPCC